MNRRETIGRILWLVEAGLTGWFFVQALRFLFGTLYAHISSADIVLRLGLPADAGAGAVLPAVAQAEVIAVGVAMLLPVLAFLLARRPLAFPVTASLVAVGRVFMTVDAPFVGALGAAIVVTGGALYLVATARQLPMRFAVAVVLGLLLDQIVRAYGQTLDPTWVESYLPVQTVLSIFLFVAAVVRASSQGRSAMAAVQAYSGISLWGGLSFGGLLFLELALLGLPNAVARWTGMDYTVVAPWLIAATALPLIPEVRDVARRMLTLVDVQWRGWFYLMFVALLLVVGNRINGIVAMIAVIVVQILIILVLWWIVGPVGKDTRDVTGPAVVLGFMVLLLLFAGDFFTYEYAFVRDFGASLDWLARLLRAMRGLGLAVMLVGVALTAVPLMDSVRRIPWQRGKRNETFSGALLMVLCAVLVTLPALPPNVVDVREAGRMRVASYNVHGGYGLYFDYSLEQMAQTIRESGANVVLLQEVDTGRLVSFGTDQALWLGRQLGMNIYYLPANEKLQGLAVLSSVPVVLDEGVLLTSQGMQTGLQRVQVRPDDGVLDVYNSWLGLLYATDQEVLALQEQDQWRQLNEALGVIAADHPGGVLGRIIFGGTFNNTPDTPLAERMIEFGFNDPFDGMPLSQSATLLRGDALQARLDYLWLRNVQPIGRAVLTSDASDHRLAVVELNLTQ